MPVTLWGGPTTVNQTTNLSQRDPDVATLADGRVIITWVDDSTPDNRIMYRIFNTDGSPEGDEILVHTVVGSDLRNPVVTALESGGWAIAYDRTSSGNDLRRHFDSAGNVLSSSLTSGALVGDHLEIVSVGSEFWQFSVSDGANNSISAFRTNSTTSAGAGAFTVQSDLTGVQVDPAATQLNNGNVVIAWREGSELEFRIFDSSANAQTADIVVSNGAVDADNSSYGKPHLLALDNGGFLITWADGNSPFPGANYDVWGRIYEPDGTLFGSTLLLNSTISGNQFNPVTVALKNGGFALFYNTNDGLNEDVRGQLFDVLGNRIGVEFAVTGDNVSTEIDSMDATLLDDGRILVSWTQFLVDGSGNAIVSQIIDPRDGAIFGDFSANTIYGGRSDDDIIASGGNDVVYGMQGQDKILGNDGSDILNGGQDNDELFGQDDDDTLNGDAGDDYLEGGRGDDILNGGEGSDTAAYVDAAAGVTQFLLFTGLDTGGAGVDTLTSIENLTGSTFDDRLVGDGNDNVLTGGDGIDILKGKGGNDTFFGGAGDDKLTGGAGDDTMFGGAGSDRLIALAGFDTLNGGDGNDFLFGGKDNDVLNGDAGADNIRGNLGVDIINGGSGSDTLRGGGQNDTINGGADNDFLFGENHSDTLFGGAGDDSLTGGFGGGVLDGFTDTFVYKDTAGGGGGFDRIKDFENGIDVMDLQSFGFADFAAVQAISSNSGVNMRINFGGGDVLFVENFQLADFDAGDVLI